MPDSPSRPQRLRQYLWSSPVLLMIITLLCWSGNFVLGRAVHADVPPVGLSFWRWLLAFVLVPLYEIAPDAVIPGLGLASSFGPRVAAQSIYRID